MREEAQKFDDRDVQIVVPRPDQLIITHGGAHLDDPHRKRTLTSLVLHARWDRTLERNRWSAIDMEIIAEKAGRFRVARDLENGLIKAELKGFWEISDADAFGPAIMKAASEMTARHGRMSLVVDASGAPVQMGDVIEQSSSWSHALSSPGNKVAVIISTSLIKLQLARRVSEKSDNIKFFTSAEAAELWILSDVAAIA